LIPMPIRHISEGESADPSVTRALGRCSLIDKIIDPAIVDCRGQSKREDKNMDNREPVKIRVLTLHDLDAVVDIDHSLLGKERREYWEARLEFAGISGVPSLAAEADGDVVGFMLGRARGWEYGVPESIGWIDTVGVRKAWQGKGVARQLFREMMAMFKEVGVEKVYVFVNWRDWDLLRFFDTMGFSRGDMINLEKEI